MAGYGALAMTGSFALCAAPLLFARNLPAGWGRILGFAGFISMAMIWAFFFAWIKVYERLDEFQRAQAKTATYWGVGGGLAASAPIYAFVVTGGLNRLVPGLAGGPAVAVAFAGGYGLALAFISFGALIATFWLRRGAAFTPR